MRKKQAVPIVLAVLAIVVVVFIKIGGDKLEVDYLPVAVHKHKSFQYDLKVYVENSGSMDGYMCSGSELKNAVYDYVSDLSKDADSSSFYYINSKVIPVNKDADGYIKSLTPSSFASAGGSRANTDLVQIFRDMLSAHEANTVTVFVSDCILDLPGGDPTDFFGHCTVSMKSAFNSALTQHPNLGVEILQMESKFDGMWYCGTESTKLSCVKRPYYIWVIGDRCLLAQINKKYPVSDIYGGAKNHCAFVGNLAVPFEIEQKRLTSPRGGKCNIQVVASLDESLQSANMLKTTATSTTGATVSSVTPIKTTSEYSHKLIVAVQPNPGQVIVNFNQPIMPKWVTDSDDTTGTDVEHNINKTTGLKALVEGVSNAYKGSANFGTIRFDIKLK